MNPILLDIPEKLETTRLVLHAAKAGDGQVVNSAIRESIDELKPWMPFAQSIPAVEETELNIRKAYVKFLQRESFRYLIFEKVSNEFVGSISIQNINWKIPHGEIGYWVRSSFTGKGYMTEAVERLTKFGFSDLNLKRIEIRCDAKNLKSRAIPERLGFELEGILRNEDWSVDQSELRDTCVYAKLV